ncbi:DUF262 domain-containing protein [Shewanella algae]|uniref:DUF262 domain-containing protein n=1 Tax=Shewanella algae TaxID=38313 RepID=UPI001AACDD71|nr:DUF262 domain-containing protein [Shewanella algae]MBO2650489.1 DUF262 domain-containing protein [Shewanella algae]
MNFNTVQNSINEILSVKRRYVIPRNQREFSWEKMQLDEFWDDVMRNIVYSQETSEFSFSEYFLGTIVLAGSESSSVLEVIDGQQRLSVITIALSIISRQLRAMGYESAANDIFNDYIVTNVSSGKLSKDSQRVAKLEKTNENDFFKLKFQAEKDYEPQVVYEEDEKLLYAGKYIQRKLERGSACELLKKKRKGVKYTEEEYVSCLDAIQKMLTNYLTVVRISVGVEEDAYDIFEILNARGISLTSIDLIKNKILQYCTETYPLDFAKKQWTDIDEELKQRNAKLTLVDYVRTYWLANNAYVGQDGLYRAFKKLIADTPESKAQTFLNELHEGVCDYAKICAPQVEDWKTQDQKVIFQCLNALSVIDVSVPRPIIMSAMYLRNNKRRLFKQTDFIELLKRIVSFHFRYNAICKLKPSGWDQNYSSWAIRLRRCANKRDIQELLNEVYSKLEDRVPSESEFVAKFVQNLWFTNNKTSQKNLIRFIFDRIECEKRNTGELTAHLYTLEHICPQKNENDYVGFVGNLLPLCSDINGDIADKVPSEKLDYYKRSELTLVKDFVISVEAGEYELADWNKEQVVKRTEAIAKLAYDLV